MDNLLAWKIEIEGLKGYAGTYTVYESGDLKYRAELSADEIYTLQQWLGAMMNKIISDRALADQVDK